MTDKEFRRLKRSELIEIIYQYQQNEKNLMAEIDRLKEQLADRKLKIEKAGSIAEAALELSGIFEAAQKAADEYLEFLKSSAGYNSYAADPDQEEE